MANEFVYNDVPGSMGPAGRVRWSSVIAGVLIGLVTYVLLSMLGLAVGLSAMDPARMLTQDYTGLGMGGGLWMIISLLIATFVGAWVSSWWGQTMTSAEGVLHGILTWSLMLLLLLMVIGRGFGSLMDNAISLLGAGITAKGPAIQERMVSTRPTHIRMVPVAPIENRLGELISSANSRDPNYKDLNASPVLKRQAAEQIAMGNDLNATRMLSNRTGITPLQARTLVDTARLETRNVSIKVLPGQKVLPGKRIVGEREVARQVTDTASRMAWWGFFSVLLSLIAAAIGGMLGRRARYTR